jgi:hypothetical protein
MSVSSLIGQFRQSLPHVPRLAHPMFRLPPDVKGTVGGVAADFEVAAMDFELDFSVFTVGFEVADGSGDVQAAKFDSLPTSREVGFNAKGVQSCRAKAEESFYQNAAVKGAFGRKVTLVAFGPCLNGVGNMVAEQSASGVGGEVGEDAVLRSGGERAAHGVKGGAVPEGLTPHFGADAVRRPEMGGEEGIERAHGPIIDSHRQRGAYPGAQGRVAFIVAVGLEAVEVRAEERFDSVAQGSRAASVLLAFRLIQVASEVGGGYQRIIGEGGRVEVSVSRPRRWSDGAGIPDTR